MHGSTAESIRSAFHSLVESRLGRSIDAPMTETTLVRDGMYCGRRFILEGFSLVWFQEERQVKLFDTTGRMTLSCSLDEWYRTVERTEQSPVRRAA